MPDRMNEWGEVQIAEGRHGNVSEYFRDLVRRDQERRQDAIRELKNMLDRAEIRGVSERRLEDVIVAARAEAREKGLLGD